MTGRTETRVWVIRCRAQRYRRRYENRLLFCLTVCSLLLLAGIGVLFERLQTPGVAAVTKGYGAVLLQSGARAYVVIGIAAFVIGVAVTVLCIRLKNKSTNRTYHTEESEEKL